MAFVYLVKMVQKDGQGIANVIAAYAEMGGARELARDYNCDRERIYGKDDKYQFIVDTMRLRDR